MKRLICLLYVATLTACNLPAWDGDPAQCEAVVQNICVRGLPAQDVEAALVAATETFGAFDASGFLVEGVVGEFSCGSEPIANGCIDHNHKYIKVSINSYQCPIWILGHEFGHLAIAGSDHSDIRWSYWYMRRNICP